jgi:hypothetical protein
MAKTTRNQIPGGPAKRRSAPSKAAEARKQNARRSASAKKAARTRAKSDA